MRRITPGGGLGAVVLSCFKMKYDAEQIELVPWIQRAVGYEKWSDRNFNLRISLERPSQSRNYGTEATFLMFVFTFMNAL